MAGKTTIEKPARDTNGYVLDPGLKLWLPAWVMMSVKAAAEQPYWRRVLDELKQGSEKSSLSGAGSIAALLFALWFTGFWHPLLGLALRNPHHVLVAVGIYFFLRYWFPYLVVIALLPIAALLVGLIRGYDYLTRLFRRRTSPQRAHK